MLPSTNPHSDTQTDTSNTRLQVDRGLIQTMGPAAAVIYAFLASRDEDEPITRGHICRNTGVAHGPRGTAIRKLEEAGLVAVIPVDPPDADGYASTPDCWYRILGVPEGAGVVP